MMSRPSGGSRTRGSASAAGCGRRGRRWRARRATALTWPMTSRLRRKWRAEPARALPSLSASTRLKREAWSAGQSAVGMPANADDDERERVDPPVRGPVRVDGDVAGRRQGLQGLARPAREEEATSPAHAASTRPSIDLEPDEAEAARAERRPDDEVALACERARDHQVRDVGARDEEDERHHRREHRGEDRQELGDARVGPRAVLGDRPCARVPLCSFGIRRREAAGHDLDLGARVVSVLPARGAPSAGTSARRGRRACPSPSASACPSRRTAPSRSPPSPTTSP